jgi:hypothetical protein
MRCRLVAFTYNGRGEWPDLPLSTYAEELNANSLLRDVQFVCVTIDSLPEDQFSIVHIC